jgi:predicted nucleotidyltransferase
MTLSPEILSEIVERLVVEFDPERIILFGSHAWGNPDEDSDIDLLVIVSETNERPIARAVRAHRCLHGISLPMDLIVKTQQEVNRFEKVSSSLEAEILRRGKVLYGRGETRAGTTAQMVRLDASSSE